MVPCNAPINVKPEEVGGGGGNPREIDCDVYPQGGDFDHFDLSITKSRREINHTFDHYFLPGGGDFDNFFRKCQNPHLCPTPPPSGLTLIGA